MTHVTLTHSLKGISKWMYDTSQACIDIYSTDISVWTSLDSPQSVGPVGSVVVVIVGPGVQQQ
jgi:hypothetical protein